MTDGSQVVLLNKSKLPTNDLLHRNPALYEQVFDVSAADVCLDIFHRFLPRLPATVLDVGCGTGRDLNRLASLGIRCTGIDFVPTMIEYAKATYPGIDFQVADMRELQLSQRFDVILALGSGINYMLENADLERALAAFRRHANPGTLLIIEPLNTSSFVGSGTPPVDFRINTEDVKARGRDTYAWHPVTQVLERQRTWFFEDDVAPVNDNFRLRLLFSRELTYFLESAGFEVLDIFERQRSKVYAKSLYIVAQLPK